uniref:Arachidonate 15-lipoxygenase type B n=1 Tax=Astyanax mexicanus TaxID=7994 RepID=A0A8B9LJ21_ASTMX
VELEARSGFLHFLKDWFCAKLVVTTPEGDEVVFPCYQWLDSKKPIVSLRNIIILTKILKISICSVNFVYQLVYLVHSLTLSLSCRWKKNSDLPSSIDADSASNLPNEVRFSFTKDMEMMFTAVKQHWQEDEFFGYQTLNGLNPMLIERCTKLPSNFPVTEDMVRSSLEGSSLETEMTVILNSTITPEKTLKPIAIQLLQKPDKNNPIFLPTDSQWDWLLAKIFVRNAEFHEHELNFHLLRTHLHLLISPGGIFDKFTSIGQKDAVKTYLPNVFSTLTYSSLCLPENIKERGLEDIPNYFYRDEAQKLWDIIKKYVDGVVKCYYLSAEDVEKDSELQNWISEIFNFGFLGREQSGSANPISGWFDFGGWMPNLPTALRLPPQCKEGVTTEETIFQTLPDVTITIHAIAVLYLLSKKSSDHVSLQPGLINQGGRGSFKNKRINYTYILNIISNKYMYIMARGAQTFAFHWIKLFFLK